MNEMDFLKKALLENQQEFSDTILEKFLQYLHLMRQWNRLSNLTSILDPKEMIMLHILDSLSIRPFLQGNHILDVGSGAGLPGIPLALIMPDKQFVLLDSNHKKTRFLTHVVLALKLKNVKVLHKRVEDLPNDIKFDSILSRAFASLQVMLERTAHLVTDEGQFLAMKGIYPKEELENIPPHFQLIAVHQLTVKGLQAERHLVVLRKTN